jgi:capsular exopolysaccharide synthesis family protein
MPLPIEQVEEPAAPSIEPVPRVLVQEEDKGYSLEQIFAMLRRRRGVIAAVTILGMALAVTASVLIPAKYTATAAVSVDESEPRFADITIDEPAGAASKSAIDTKIALITSRPLLTQVMDELYLYDDPLFNPRPLYQRALDWFSTVSFYPPSEFAKAGPAPNTLLTVDAPKTPPSETVKQAAFERFQRLLLVTQAITEAEVINISFTLADPERAAAVANALANAYVRWEIEHRQQMARQAALWIAPRLKELQTAVQQAEQAAADFRVNHGLSITGTEGGTLNDQRIASLNEGLVALRAEQIQKRAKLERIRASRNSASVITELPASSIIPQLRAQEVDLQRQRAQLAQTVGQNHPQMIDLNAQIEEIEWRVQVEIDQSIASMRDELSMLASRAMVIEKEMQTLQAGSVRDRQAEVGEHELERQAGIQRDLYQAYLARYQEAREEMEVARSKAQVISPAAPPATPSTPGPIVIGFVGFTSSLMLGSILALLRERLDRRVQSARQLEDALSIPTLGYLPLIRQRRLRKHPASYIAEQPYSFFAEAAQSIITRLNRPSGARSSVVMVTSALPDEGKTTLAVSLAAAVVLAGLRAVVVELDLRNPSIASRIETARPRVSLIDYLTGKVTYAEILQHDSKSGIDVITVEKTQENPLRLLRNPLLDALVRALRTEYDQVILDSPPLLAVSEATIAARLADCFVLVARWKTTEVAAVAEALRQLFRSSPRPVGLVLTRVDLKKYKLYSRGEAGSYFKHYQKYYVK